MPKNLEYIKEINMKDSSQKEPDLQLNSLTKFCWNDSIFYRYCIENRQTREVIQMPAKRYGVKVKVLQ